MTETSTPQPPNYDPNLNPGHYPMQPNQQWTPPPPVRGPSKLRRGTVTVAAVATLFAGAVGGTVGAIVGSAHQSNTPVAQSTAPALTTSSTQQSGDVSAVVAKVLPSVVQVNVSSANAEGIGSGVIVSADGKILTNNHVVSGAEKITVTMSDGRTVDASVLTTEASSDLAVIQAKGVSGLTPATLGDSGSVKVGDEVIAIGSPAGLQGTVTTGIVSALDREVTVPAEQRQQSPFPFSRNGSSAGSTVTYHAIQTDASINQGNSGGPLFDLSGAVIGINSAMYSPVSSSDGSAGSVGIGFAIPVNQAKGVIG